MNECGQRGPCPEFLLSPCSLWWVPELTSMPLAPEMGRRSSRLGSDSCLYNNSWHLSRFFCVCASHCAKYFKPLIYLFIKITSELL